MTVIANLHDKPLGEAMLQGNAAVKALRSRAGVLHGLYGSWENHGRGDAKFCHCLRSEPCVYLHRAWLRSLRVLSIPVTIMVSMFLSLPFGILSLILTDRPLSIYSVLGVFLLMGVVKKNAILQVDYTNHLREKGMCRMTLRLLPIGCGSVRF